MNYNPYKKEMLVELCAGNYVTSNGFVNGVNGTFKTSTTYCEKTIIWTMFHNYKIGTLVTKKEERPECFQAPCLTPPLEDPVRPLRGTVCLLLP